MLSNFLAAVIIAILVLGFCIALVGAVVQTFAGVGGLAGDDEPAASLPRGPVVDVARGRLPALAAAPARDPVIGSDDATADRHARLRAFQQRDPAERAARRLTTRGY